MHIKNQPLKKGTGKMENTAYIALSGQSVLKRKLDVIANNLANMNTNAYKGENMLFVQHLVNNKSDQTATSGKLSYARDIAQYYNLDEGPLRQTGNPLDLAIHGKGYFVVDTENGERFSRNGHLSLGSDGRLVNSNNQPILSKAGTPFFFAPDDKKITIAPDGTVSTDNGPLGQIRIVEFEKPQELQKRSGGLLFTEEQASDVETPNILQGKLESSNIKPITEITQMIEVQRAYESVRKFIDKEDSRQRKMIQDLTPRI